MKPTLAAILVVSLCASTRAHAEEMVRDVSSRELVPIETAIAGVDSVVLATLTRAELQLCTGCGSGVFEFEQVSLLNGHDATLAPLGGQCFTIPEGLPSSPEALEETGLEELVTDGCRVVRTGSGPLYLLGVSRSDGDEDLGLSHVSWLLPVDNAEAARALVADATDGPAAVDDFISSVSTPARQQALRVFVEQRRSQQPAATFTVAGRVEEGGSYADLTVWLSEPGAECADSLWLLRLIDIDSGVTALDRAERLGRLCCSDTCVREPTDWMLALNTFRESDPEYVAGLVHPERGVTVLNSLGEEETYNRDEVSMQPELVPSWGYRVSEVSCGGTRDGFGCTAIWNGTQVGIEWAGHNGTPYIVAIEVIEWE